MLQIGRRCCRRCGVGRRAPGAAAAAEAGDGAAAAVNAATILCETLTLTRAVREHLTLEAVGVGSGWEHPRHHRVLGRF